MAALYWNVISGPTQLWSQPTASLKISAPFPRPNHTDRRKYSAPMKEGLRTVAQERIKFDVLWMVGYLTMLY
jgi:hypothetical protein